MLQRKIVVMRENVIAFEAHGKIPPLFGVASESCTPFPTSWTMAIGSAGSVSGYSG
jgi:hypothetical protein